MGNWTLVIHGVGIHHNNKPDDIDKIAPGLVNDLRLCGQYITGATLTYGGAMDVSSYELPVTHDLRSLTPIVDPPSGPTTGDPLPGNQTTTADPAGAYTTTGG